MKTLIDLKTAAVILGSFLGACASAQSASISPLSGNIIGANAHLPIVAPTDSSRPAGSIVLLTQTKGSPLIVNLDINGNPSAASDSANQLSSLSFKCLWPQQGTLDKCVDAELDVSVKGSDNKPHPLVVQVRRRGNIPVDEKIIDPKNPHGANMENSAFGKAFYIGTQVTDPNALKTINTIRVLETAYIVTAAAKNTDTPKYQATIGVGSSNMVRFYLAGPLVDIQGNAVACASTNTSGSCSADTSISAIDPNSLNLVKSYIVRMSDGSLKTVVLTVQSRNDDDNKTLVGTTDVSTMYSTVVSP